MASSWTRGNFSTLQFSLVIAKFGLNFERGISGDLCGTMHKLMSFVYKKAMYKFLIALHYDQQLSQLEEFKMPRSQDSIICENIRHLTKAQL